MPAANLTYIIVAVLGFGSAFALNNIVVGHMSPLAVAAIRASIAAIATAVYLRWYGVKLPITRKHLSIYLLLGMMTAVVPFSTLALGQKYITSSLAGVVFASIPLFTLLFGPIVLKNHALQYHKIGGALLGLVGVAIAISGGGIVPDKNLLIGGGLTLGAAICFAIGGLLVRRFGDVDPRALSLGQLMCAAIVLLVLTTAKNGIGLELTRIDIWTALVFLGVFSTAAPMIAIYLLISRAGPASASLITFFIPFVAVTIGAVLLHEPLTPSLAVGFVLVIAGAWWVARPSPAPVD